MALPTGTTGSLCPAFAPDRLVGLSVKLACANTLNLRLPYAVSEPWEASVTLLEATTPVKLPTKRCPFVKVRTQLIKGWYFILRLHDYWRNRFTVSHLFYTSINHVQR